MRTKLYEYYELKFDQQCPAGACALLLHRDCVRVEASPCRHCYLFCGYMMLLLTKQPCGIIDEAVDLVCSSWRYTWHSHG